MQPPRESRRKLLLNSGVHGAATRNCMGAHMNHRHWIMTSPQCKLPLAIGGANMSDPVSVSASLQAAEITRDTRRAGLFDRSRIVQESARKTSICSLSFANTLILPITFLLDNHDQETYHCKEVPRMDLVEHCRGPDMLVHEFKNAAHILPISPRHLREALAVQCRSMLSRS